jgi:hypothetical protein
MREIMKPKFLATTTLLFAAHFLVSCAQSGAVNTAPTSGPLASPTTISTPDRGLVTVPGVPGAPGVTTGSSSSNTVSLDASAGALSGMFFQSGAVNPRNITMTMSTYNSGAGYAGSVTISYIDDRGSHGTTLTTTHPQYPSTSNAEYNVWLNATQWHGFFQDSYGAIVVVIDRSVGLGDGGSKLLGGSIYYQNFGPRRNPLQGPNRMCWQINPVEGASTAPYDCRTFLTSFADGALPVTTSSLVPNNSGQGRPAYTLLGKFDGLNQQAALGN